jgi:hypothetical protein
MLKNVGKGNGQLWDFPVPDAGYLPRTKIKLENLFNLHHEP